MSLFTECPQVSPGTQVLSATLCGRGTTITTLAVSDYSRTLIYIGLSKLPDCSSLLFPSPHPLRGFQLFPLFICIYYPGTCEGGTKGRQAETLPLCYRLAPIKCLNNWPHWDIVVSLFIPVLWNLWAEGGWARISMCRPHGGLEKSEEIWNRQGLLGDSRTPLQSSERMQAL